MQILWKEVFGKDLPLTMDEFLYCYKPLEINQSLSFYLFTARGNDCRLIRSLVSSDRNWKTEFIFISGFWAGHPVDVGRDTFAPYTGDLGNFRPEGMSLPFFFITYIIIIIIICMYLINLYLLIALQLLDDLH